MGSIMWLRQVSRSSPLEMLHDAPCMLSRVFIYAPPESLRMKIVELKMNTIT